MFQVSQYMIGLYVLEVLAVRYGFGGLQPWYGRRASVLTFKPLLMREWVTVVLFPPHPLHQCVPPFVSLKNVLKPPSGGFCQTTSPQA